MKFRGIYAQSVKSARENFSQSLIALRIFLPLADLADFLSGYIFTRRFKKIYISGYFFATHSYKINPPSISLKSQHKRFFTISKILSTFTLFES
ncbi:hypothetical protein ASC72_10905 [Flavobacterium sp. Root420]|nr:hypothetical protein ASC72_10905 [Flavobacterium sp. Root420]